MCLKWFKKQSAPMTPPPVPAPIKLPHPEEPVNLSQTMTNTSIPDVLTQWFKGWNVPEENQQYFANQIIITLSDTIPYPAATYQDGNTRHLVARPEYANGGVIAHEQAHNSYALLTNEQKAAFTILFDSLKNTDPKLVYLWSVNSYGLKDDVEGHAETYRYWGSEMPEELKQYYPKLF